MKKLAIIGMVFAGLMLSSAGAWAQPTGMTKAEYRALMLRSEGMNQRYGLGQYSQQAINNKLGEIGAWAVSSPQQTNKYSQQAINNKLGEIGAWAVSSPQQTNKYSQQAINNKLGEIGAWAVSSPQQTNAKPLVSEKLAGLNLSPTTTNTSGDGFNWNDAAIGAALAFGFVVLGVGSLLTVRQQHKPIPH
jgi:hypothetical protein